MGSICVAFVDLIQPIAQPRHSLIYKRNIAGEVGRHSHVVGPRQSRQLNSITSQFQSVCAHSDGIAIFRLLDEISCSRGRSDNVPSADRSSCTGKIADCIRTSCHPDGA
jgi:hypothetical protein